MKLIRFGKPGQEKPGLVNADGQRKDCSACFDDWNHEFFQNSGLSALTEIDVDRLPNVPDDVRWGSCVSRPGKVVCIGGNYADHCRESDAAIPQEPLLFMKAPNAVVGPYDPIIIPRGSKHTDWEIEVGVIIGKNARYLESEAEAADYIAGYTIVNDVSERDFQVNHCGQFTKGKSADNFCPLGPYLVTRDEIEDPFNLTLELTVNGIRRQYGNTRDMVHNFYFLVYYISQYMTLEAGDLISTGTPAGVGAGMKPPTFLKAGDVVKLSIEGLGTQQQTCVDAD